MKRRRPWIGPAFLALALLGCDSDGSDEGSDGPADDGAGTADDAGDDEGDDEADADGDADADADADDEGDDDEGATDDGDAASGFATDIAPIIAASCGCHTGGAPSAGLDLNEGVAYGALVDVMSGAGIPFVTPGDSANSYLVNKLDGTQADVGGSGGQMPVGGALADGDIATVVAWIDAGAAE